MKIRVVIGKDAGTLVLSLEYVCRKAKGKGEKKLVAMFVKGQKALIYVTEVFTRAQRVVFLQLHKSNPFASYNAQSLRRAN